MRHGVLQFDAGGVDLDFFQGNLQGIRVFRHGLGEVFLCLSQSRFGQDNLLLQQSNFQRIGFHQQLFPDFGQICDGLGQRCLGQGNLSILQGQFHWINVGNFQFQSIPLGYRPAGDNGQGLGFQPLPLQSVRACPQFGHQFPGINQRYFGHQNRRLQLLGFADDADAQLFELSLQRVDIVFPAPDV